jgi:hypothetical protein
MGRRARLVFPALQAVGEMCAWTAGRFLSATGPRLWVAGFFLLMPRDLVGPSVVEKLFLGFIDRS